MPFVRAGIPAVELISLDYGPFNIFWHTPFDTVGKCSAVSLGIVGRVLLDALDDLESGRTPKPLLALLESGAAGMGCRLWELADTVVSVGGGCVVRGDQRAAPAD